MIEDDSFFVDSNIFLYTISALETDKRRLAVPWLDSLWSGRRGRISWQVVHEVYVRAVQKLRVSPESARFLAEKMIQWDPEPPGHPMISRAWHWCDRTSINFWDAMIVAAAEQAGCQWLLSEDFQAGRKFGSVTVVNPFERDPSDFGFA